MKKIALLSAVAMVGLAQATNASVVTLSVDTANIAAYNNTTDFTPVPLYPYTLTTDVVYELPIMFQLDGLAPGQSFGNISLDITVSGGLTKETGPGGTTGPVWLGNPTTYPFGKIQQAYFDSNSDQGNATADGPGDKDGIGVVAYINAGIPSPQRAAMGIGSPFFLGWAYFYFPHNANPFTSRVTITPTQFSYSQGGVLTVDNSARLVGETLTFIPEPASNGLVGAGLLSIMTRRRSARGPRTNARPA